MPKVWKLVLNMANKIVEYIRESKSELKKVVWPSRREAFTNTLWVIGVSLAFAVFFTLIDLVLNKGVTAIIAR